MRFTPDLTKAVPRLVPGIYKALLAKVESHNSKAGTQCVKTTYEVCEGSFAKCRVSVITPLSGKGASFFVDLARCFDPAYIDGEIDLSPHVGKKVVLDVADARGMNGERSYLKIFPREVVRNEEVTAAEESSSETQTQ